MCLFLPLDRLRAEVARKLQEMCKSLTDEDFVRVLQNYNIHFVNFSRKDVKIAKNILRYSEHAAKGKIKYPRKGVKIKNNTEQYLSVSK